MTLTSAGNLTTGHTRSCGCLGKKFRKDVIGKTFGRLMARWPAGKGKGGVSWLCSCECGKLTVVTISRLLNGTTKSCGCLATESKKSRCVIHGQDRAGLRTPEYAAYTQAKNRCENSAGPKYDYYGGRGIRFKFQSFGEFFAELGKRPANNYSLDRKNNDGHYEPGNVRWATKKEQANNRRKACR
jgi:hypothetical protein